MVGLTKATQMVENEDRRQQMNVLLDCEAVKRCYANWECENTFIKNDI